MTNSQLVVDGNSEMRLVTSGEELGRVSRAETTSEVRVPEDILARYIDVAMRRAVPRRLEDEATWFADLPGFSGVWADGSSVKQCMDALSEVLREWVILKIVDEDRDLPVVDNIDLTVLYTR